MKLLSFLSLTLCLSSCYQNKACEPNYIGTFIVDTSNLHSTYKKIIVDHKWLTVKLISESNGKYYIDTNDPILKKCEGSWYTNSNNIDGDCFGYIKQKNQVNAFNTDAFNIHGNINDSIKFVLHFRKTTN